MKKLDARMESFSKKLIFWKEKEETKKSHFIPRYLLRFIDNLFKYIQ